MRCLVLICCMMVCYGEDAFCLSTITEAGLTFTFPQHEDAIVSRMIMQAPQIVSFLKTQGIPIHLPLHIFLDEHLDNPDVAVSIIPHREIQIPLRAPGALEEGYLEKDPWTYFLFKGLCLQGIFSMRSGVPGYLHWFFGEIASPNFVNPPWLLDGVCSLLYARYTGKIHEDPYERAILRLPVPTDIAGMSNHPGVWPGYFGYRVYGKPFVAWLYQRYGWNAIRSFLEIHGSGIIPIEIDLKAEKAFGKSWPTLWKSFMQESGLKTSENMLLSVTGYVSDPLITWDHSGINPGPKRVRIRGRYGYRDKAGILWITEYDLNGISHIIGYRDTGSHISLDMDHLWDLSPGCVGITREGSRPILVRLSINAGILHAKATVTGLIPAPPGAIQLSGPVIDGKGRIAVAASIDGNWDIWVYEKAWRRITTSSSIEIDPWWTGDTLVFASNISGTFQIHQDDMTQVSWCINGAFLPKDKTALCLGEKAWSVEPYTVSNSSPVQALDPVDHADEKPSLSPRPYSPLESIFPNFITPDLYIGVSDVQVGLASWGRDVSEDYGLNAGARYSFAFDYLALRAGFQIKEMGIQVTRYPFVCRPAITPETEESRKEYRLSFTPDFARWMEASLNALDYEPLEGHGADDVDLFTAVTIKKAYEDLAAWVTIESYSGGRKSLFGGLRWIMGRDVYSVFNVEAGKTWEGYTPGHGTYRVGGDIGEGYFTKRPSRLFPVRGFPSDILEAGKAVSSCFEVYWPLADIQKGHQTLPLFFHRLWLGTFIDSGVCSDTMTRHDILAGAGIELLTSFEVAWGNLSNFRVGISWPVVQPDYLSERGPLLIFQLGRPL